MDTRDEILRFDPELPFREASTPPSSWYTSPEIAARESELVFGRSWQLAARADQLGGPGDYVAGVTADEPWVVLRDGTGALAAFSNVCRHKATTIMVGAGRVDALVCPYHGWTYGLDGRLASAPRLGSVIGFDREACSLPELAAVAWGPLVLMHGEPGAPSPAAACPELDAALTASGWADLIHVGRREYEVACNWKAFCDNYLDGGYHIAHLHPTLDAQLDLRTYRTALFERCSIQSVAGADGGDARIDFDPGQRIGTGALYAFVYPNLMINRYGPVLDTNLVHPVGPQACRVVFDVWMDAAVTEEFIATSLRQMEQTQREDVDISASVQAGLRSRRYDRARYASPETGGHHFHRLLAADLRRGLGA